MKINGIKFFVILLTGSAVFIAGCGTSPKIRKLESNIRRLNDKIENQNDTIDKQNEKIKRIPSQRIKSLSNKLDTAMKRAKGNIQRRKSNIKEKRNQIKNLMKEQKDLEQKLNESKNKKRRIETLKGTRQRGDTSVSLRRVKKLLEDLEENLSKLENEIPDIPKDNNTQESKPNPKN